MLKQICTFNKGQYIKKIELGIIYLPRKNNL